MLSYAVVLGKRFQYSGLYPNTGMVFRYFGDIVIVSCINM